MKRGNAKGLVFGAASLGFLVLAACEPISLRASLVPPNRPADLTGEQAIQPSAASQDLARYYRIVQNDQLTLGLLRTDGGGPDTPYDADDLDRNFEQIAFFDEYERGATFQKKLNSAPGRLSRWSGPVRFTVQFGDSVPAEQRAKDQADIEGYAARLARVTDHPISVARGRGNFHVFIAGEDDRDFVQRRLRELLPGIAQNALESFRSLPRQTHCFVIAFSNGGSPDTYNNAVALIRSEHPDLLRLSCIHEELAQGLGLPNDSPRARPSIFNDDDEFALLTSHDEKLLTILYDPRLKPGMSAEAARPVARIISREIMGQPL